MKINRIVKYLVLSDLVFWTGWGLFNPVFAIFIVERIQGGNAFVVGLAVAIYWIVKSCLRVPVGMFLDSLPSEKDDYLFAVVGLFIVSLIPFGYYFSYLPWHIYLLQGIHGVAMAMTLSGWQAIFTKHIDKRKEATEWGLDATAVGLGIGFAGIVGGWAVTKFGFDMILIVVGIFGLAGTSLLLFLRNDIKGVFDHGFHFSFKEIFQKEEKK